jgi:hypothetical protein
MSELIKYPWTAVFKDSTIIKQFNEDGSENLFREVLDRQDGLRHFRVGKITVDLLDGSFLVDGVTLFGSTSREYSDETVKKRIIYFRITTRVFNAATLQQNSVNFVYAIGWQATIDGKNVKHIMYLHPNGKVVFE